MSTSNKGRNLKVCALSTLLSKPDAMKAAIKLVSSKPHVGILGATKSHSSCLQDTGAHLAMGFCDINNIVSLAEEITESGKWLGVFKGRDNSV